MSKVYILGYKSKVHVKNDKFIQNQNQGDFQLDIPAHLLTLSPNFLWFWRNVTPGMIADYYFIGLTQLNDCQLRNKRMVDQNISDW